jgi:NADH-quinone oxidoreductase subunit M
MLGRRNPAWPRGLALAATLSVLALGLYIGLTPPENTPWLRQVRLPWIPQLGVGMHLAVDGLSLLLVLLTGLLGSVAVIVAWREITDRVGFFYFNLLAALAGLIGVFLALDLILFFCCWELMLVPVFLLITIWGQRQRHEAAIKFLLFTQLSGLLMLLAMLALVFVHWRVTGQFTFNYVALLGTMPPPAVAMLLFLGFFAAFAVKLHIVPVHSWAPDAYVAAPTAVSVVLAGIMLKAGAYGLLRFAIPLFPQSAEAFAPVAMGLAVITILYGAVLALGQTELKRWLAYAGISHMGVALLGVFAWNQWSLHGVVILLLAHGIGTAGLFVLARMVRERCNSADLRDLGGLWSTMPRLSAVAMLLMLALLGLPGMGTFIGEFLVLLGAFGVSPLVTALAALGIILSAVYTLRVLYRGWFGPPRDGQASVDLSRGETALMAVLVGIILWLGLFPQPVLRAVSPSIDDLRMATRGLMVMEHPAPLVRLIGWGGER